MSRSKLASTERTRLRRRPQRGHHDRLTIDRILDEAFVCHVGFEHEGYVSVLPTAYVRQGDNLYLHGSTGNRMLRALRDGAVACVCVTLVDGLVLARSAFHHSVNYRSLVLFGTAREVTNEQKKLEILEHFVESVVPKRSADVRPPSSDELKQTLVIRFPIVEGSAKVRSGPPVDEDKDLAIPCWAGEIPLQLAAGTPIPAPDLAANLPVPDYVSAYRRPTSPRRR
jgi:nitroimidazol reductase NimA-like FMN-containing flavoprotein (pyridoxamine 5'-phosphate oxidase superfamily)